MNYLFIDFEYNTSNDEFLNLVCASMALTDKDFKELEKKDMWLYDDVYHLIEFDYYLKYLASKFGEFVVICWSANAEGRSFISATQDPRSFKWIDLQAEYKMIINHNHKYMYGDQIIKGKLKRTIPPREKFQMSEADQKKANSDKPQSNLVAATFKLLGVRIDSDHKDRMRDLIIRNNYDEIMGNRTEIMSYCASDIKYLPRMFKRILEIYSNFNNHALSKEKITKDEMFWRARSVLNTAIIENNGYPVNRKWASNFTKNVPSMQLELCRDIDSQFPEGEGPFAFDTKPVNINGQYLKDLVTPKRRIKFWKQWIGENCDTRKWIKTGKIDKTTGEYGLSTSYEAWTRYFKVPRHQYERGNFAHQIVRYLNFNKQLNGFLPAKKGKAKFLDFFGNDDRVRGYLNSYGSQSARWQPKAVSFLFLKSAWMRSMCSPEEGRFICGIDYSQQEFLISALLSQDENMIEAYKTGDVYLHTAKLAGAVPPDGKREDYKTERSIYKAVTLAISYMMSCYGLSDTLTQSLKRVVDEDEAQEFIDNFYESYSDFGTFMEEEVINKYESQKYMKLADGWVMFGDNENYRSYGNCPIQGMGSCILRKVIDTCIDEGLKVIFPLHDALYIEADIEDRDKVIIKFNRIMKKSFAHFFKNKREVEKTIRTDINIWGPNCKNETVKIKDLEIKSQDIYIDERSEEEFERFKKYMITDSQESVETNNPTP